jgi:hypothetical protein
MENPTIYKAKKRYLWGVLMLFLIVFLGLTLPALIDGTLQMHQIEALVGFYVWIILLSLFPFFSWVEVGKDYVKTYLFGLRTSYIDASDVLVLEYGNLMRFGGLGYGRGVKLWAKTKSGGKRYFSPGENIYGKEAVAHVKRVLESRHG